MIHEIYSPVTDGWSTREIVLKESADAINLLRFMTKQIAAFYAKKQPPLKAHFP